jgi:hypothetical protein
MIVFGKWGFFCLNQDFQDLRIFRMLFNDCFWEVGILGSWDILKVLFYALL